MNIGVDFQEAYKVISCPTDEWHKGQHFLLHAVKDLLRIGYWPIGMVFENEHGVNVTVCGERKPGRERLEVIE